MTDLDELGIDGITGAEVVGRGGFAVVYRARQAAFHRDVAVKVLTQRPDPETLARFQREIQAMGPLGDHQAIVPLHDAGTTEEGQPYLLMPYLPGGSYQDVLDRGERLAWREAFEVGAVLAGALQAAHDHEVLHRDLKPANVLMSRYGNPMLADFGIARIVGAHETTSGVVTASLAHAAPEVLDGRRPTERSDVYGLASTIYALIAGSGPFVVADEESVLPLLNRTFRDPVPVLPDVPEAAQRLLAAAMAKDPGERPATAASLGQALRDVLDGRPRAAAAPQPDETRVHDPATLPGFDEPERGDLEVGDSASAASARRRRGQLIATAVVGLVLVGVLGVLMIDTPSAIPETAPDGQADGQDGALQPVVATAPPASPPEVAVEDPSLTGGIDPTTLQQLQGDIDAVQGTMTDGSVALQVDARSSAVLAVPVPSGAVLRAFTDSDIGDPALALFSTTGTFLAADDDNGGGDSGTNALLDIRLADGGEYRLVVASLDDQPGLIDVTVVIMVPQPLRSGSNDGILGPEMPAQSWLLEIGPNGPPGDVIRMQAEVYDSDLRLVDERGRQLATYSGGTDAAIDISELPGGTYVLIAASDDDDPPEGGYTLQVT